VNVAQAEAYLLDLELFGMRFGLDRMHKLMTVLGMPQRRFASIHVVGSNGKSSSVRFAAGILREHGLCVGAYTSPHLRSFAERIEVDGQAVPDADFAAAVARVAQAAEMVNRASGDDDDRVTQFEALTAAAYYELARRGVEVAVIEAGLGGRYDATNVIPSGVQVLTSVGLEHTRWLGPTVRDIAEEKLAVVRDHATLVVGPDLHPDAMEIAVRVARERHARLVHATPESEGPVRARGAFQRRNFALARAAAGVFLGERMDEAAVARAADSVEVPGRMQIVGEAPVTIYDGAHNGEGAAALAEALPEVVGDRPLVAVVAILDDKDANGMLRSLLPLLDGVVFTSVSNPRSLPTGTLESLASKLDDAVIKTAPTPADALELARELAGPDGAVVATGSIYLIADLVREPGAARASTL
jgi:dihydrofolate synthase/folylpolyglutamate synthase